MFNTAEFKRTVTAIVGAFVLTTTFVGAAIAPARAVETSPIVIADAALVQNSGTAQA